MNRYIAPIELAKAYRTLNHGPTVLVGGRHAGVSNVMSASWATALDYDPGKLTVVLAKGAFTRSLIEQSGVFSIQIPTAAQVELVYRVGTTSRHGDEHKLKHAGVELFEQDGCEVPLVSGCSAWLACRLIREPHIQHNYDLFIGEVFAAWSDTRAFENGRWKFDQADAAWRSLHYTTGGQFYVTGKSVHVDIEETA
ncbi:flavin reductase family protein [Pseudomonas citronellolis]|uniref:flavin reductase family protein n=1 Tax=Pseudomonas citronellolis TaxID=53408 RepID=UPI002FDAE178